jgi:hypothetical protein
MAETSNGLEQQKLDVVNVTFMQTSTHHVINLPVTEALHNTCLLPTLSLFRLSC